MESRLSANRSRHGVGKVSKEKQALWPLYQIALISRTVVSQIRSAKLLVSRIPNRADIAFPAVETPDPTSLAALKLPVRFLSLAEQAAQFDLAQSVQSILRLEPG